MTDPRLLIDKKSMDDELMNNPSLVQEVCDECAEAIAIRDAAKEALATVDAQLDAEVRMELSVSTKVTEDKVKAAIQTNPRHAEAFKAYNDAKLAAALADSLVKAVETRSKALEQLSYLYGSGYFAINSTKRVPATQEIDYDRLRDRMAVRRREVGR